MSTSSWSRCWSMIRSTPARSYSREPLDHLLERPGHVRGVARTPANLLEAHHPVVQLGLVPAHDRARHERERERLAPGGARRLVDPLAPLPAFLRRGEGRVVLVGVAHGGADGARLRRAADDEPRPGRRLRPHALVGVPVPRHDLELPLQLVHPLADRREREPVGLVLGRVPAGAHAELDAPAGDLLRRHDGLGEHRRRPEGDRRDERAEPDPLRPRRERRDRRPRVERAGLAAADDREVVVGAEQPLEARRLAGLGEREPVLPGDPFLALDHEADAHDRGVYERLGLARARLRHGRDGLHRQRPRPCTAGPRRRRHGARPDAGAGRAPAPSRL